MLEEQVEKKKELVIIKSSINAENKRCAWGTFVKD
jgi:hypothetical protein